MGSLYNIKAFLQNKKTKNKKTEIVQEVETCVHPLLNPTPSPCCFSVQTTISLLYGHFSENIERKNQDRKNHNFTLFLFLRVKELVAQIF